MAEAGTLISDPMLFPLHAFIDKYAHRFFGHPVNCCTPGTSSQRQERKARGLERHLRDGRAGTDNSSSQKYSSEVWGVGGY